MAKVAPSILSANFGNLSYDVKRIVDAGCEFLHFDVMDGHFVPNISFGATILKDINNFDIIYDVHLMISDPLKYAIDFQKAGADYITFHVEAMKDNEAIHALLDKIHGYGVKIYSNGDRTEGQFQDNTEHGKGKMNMQGAISHDG